jgi:hypothetical protein
MLGNVEPLFELSDGEWTKEPHIHRETRHLVLVEKKTHARTPPLPEVRGRVQADYTAVKRQELSDQLLRDLMTRYDVRIVPPESEDKKPAKPDEEKTP